jgi:hypothetical protein
MWSPGIRLDEVEKQVILKAFKFYGNNKTATANALGITPKTLGVKLDKYAQDAHREAQAREDNRVKRQAELDRARGIAVVPQPKAV